MAKFLSETEFAPRSKDALRLLPLRFERLQSGRYLVTNLVGDAIFLSQEELSRLTSLDLAPGDGLYERAFSKLLIAGTDQQSQLQLLALRLRSRLSYLRAMTPLHIFVVTLRCEHSCPYCQVSRRSIDRARYDMSAETAARALDVAFSAPSPSIKIEFQGGEPLLNFDLISQLVPEAEKLSRASGKRVEFVITSNLALLNDEILAFCERHSILLSTSLDGPADLHNRNRPRPGGNSHAFVEDGIRHAQQALGKDRVGALMTTTEASLDRVTEIVDEYVRLGLDGIFLRPLSPYGFAIKTKQYARYDSAHWLRFYEVGLRYIIDVNRQGIRFPEFYASMLLQRILTDRPISYVDLRSPAGIGLGALVYNYDGSVFASDEGRMLAEMGDRTFELGHVDTDNYRALILSDKLVNAVGGSLTQCAPQCVSCAYEPHCGADPVYHHATQSDMLGIKPLSDFCARQKGVLGLLLEMLEGPPEDAAVLRSWVPT